MKKIVLITFLLLMSNNITYSEEKKNKPLPDNCFDKYKISPYTLGCGFKKGLIKITTKKDGSHNFLGKFFNADSGKDLLK